MNPPRISSFKIALVAAIGGFLFGFDTGVIAGTQLFFTEYFELTPGQQGWAVGSALYGCLAGALLAGYLTKVIGRKFTLILSAVLFSVSAWGSGIAGSLTELVIYRIIGGIGIGFASMAAPMYIAEVSPPATRGKMVSLYQLAIVLGFFAVFLATYYLGGGDTASLTVEQLEAAHRHNLERGWRLMFWSELPVALAFLALLFFVPSSPRWLALQHRDQEALWVLTRLSGNEKIATEDLASIKQSLEVPQITNVKQLLLAGLGFATLLGIMLSVFQQVTGINAILYYGAEIFSSALGYGPQDALKQQLWLAAVNLVFTFVAILTVDKWGRKPLFLTGTAGMFIGLSVLAHSLYSQQVGVISLIAILLFIGSFAMSMGPVVWVMLSEMFPNRARSFAMSIAVGAQWLFNGIVANTFPLLNRSDINQSGFNGALPYMVFAFFCIVAFIFVWRLLPETKGKSLEEIEQIW
ncbi:MAG: sugar porter family MFS transporter [Arenicella sp.]|nr:sugar porter family MFS transporter [Arenicella sp.]